MDDRIRELMLLGSSTAGVNRFLDAYEASETHFISVLPEEQPNAVIAYTWDDQVVEILDIAVDPDQRRQGLGSLLIERTIARHRPAKVIAETDDDAVGFYRKLGFDCAPFESKWGNTRYKMCHDCNSDHSNLVPHNGK